MVAKPRALGLEDRDNLGAMSRQNQQALVMAWMKKEEWI